LERPERVSPVSSWKWRVSCTIEPPASSTDACRMISDRTARSTERSELTFLVSVRVPHSWPGRLSEVFTSQRIEPCSIRTSETSSARMMSRSSVTYAFATCGARAPMPGTGLVTISTSGMPARL
jgi:hypothetical protein